MRLSLLVPGVSIKIYFIFRNIILNHRIQYRVSERSLAIELLLTILLVIEKIMLFSQFCFDLYSKQFYLHLFLCHQALLAPMVRKGQEVNELSL